MSDPCAEHKATSAQLRSSRSGCLSVAQVPVSAGQSGYSGHVALKHKFRADALASLLSTGLTVQAWLGHGRYAAEQLQHRAMIAAHTTRNVNA